MADTNDTENEHPTENERETAADAVVPADPATGRDRLATRFVEAGLDPERFIRVEPGGKGSPDHTQYGAAATALDAPANYGVYATGDDPLVILDVDDYNDPDDTSGLLAVQGLPATFEQHSPHGGTHLLYVVETGDEDDRAVAEVIEDEFGKANPHPSYGEVRTENQYVVGAGSQLDDCDKEWCDECATAEGGWYTFGPGGEGDRPIATLDVATLLDALRADPALGDDPSQSELGQAVADHDDARDHTHRGHGLRDDDLIEKAKNAKNGDYFTDLWEGRWERHTHRWDGDSQSEADLAFCNLLAFWTACDRRQMDRLFRRSGLMREKWERDDYRDPTIQEACITTTETYDPSPSGDDGGEPVGVPDPDDAGSAGPDTGTGPLVPSPGGQLTVTDLPHGGYGYAVPTEDGPDPVTNFLLGLDHALETPDGETMLTLRLYPPGALDPDAARESFTVQVKPTVFNEPRDFRKAVCVDTGTWYEGGRSQLNDLRDLVDRANLRTPTRQGVKTLGVHGDELVLPDGTLTADGWADDPDHVYLRQGWAIEQKAVVSPDGQPDADYDRETVAAILDLLPQIRDPEQFLPVLGWFYTAPFRPFIQQETRKFNHLTVTGETGAGKSPTLNLLSSLFGFDPNSYSPDDTKYSLEVAMCATNAMPVFFDEYKPGDIGDYKLNRFHRFYRENTDGNGVPKGSRDGSTSETRMLTPVAVAGEQAIQGPAERRRAIMTRFRTDAAATGSETAAAFNALLDRTKGGTGTTGLADHALAFWQFALDLFATGTVPDLWTAADAKLTALLDELGYDRTEFDPLSRQGLQTLVFGCLVYRQFATHVGATADGETPPNLSDSDLAAAVGTLAEEHVDGDHRTNHLDEFLELTADAAHAGYLERDEHYTIVREGEPDSELRLSLRQAYQKVRQYVRDHDIGDSFDLLSSHGDYRARCQDAADDTSADSYVTTASQRSPPLARCVGIDMATAAAELDGFVPAAFRGPAATADADAAAASATADGGQGVGETVAGGTAVAVEEAAGDAKLGDTSYRTLTVQVADLTVDPDHLPARATATLVDETGAVDAIWWNRDAGDDLLRQMLKDAHRAAEGDATAASDTAALRLERVQLGRHEDTPQVRLKGGVTDATPIALGVGTTAPPADDADDATGGS